MTAFEPELGQMLYGNPAQNFQVPEIMEAVLIAISTEYERVYWNLKQEKCDSPFYNNGPSDNFKCETFEVQAYDWGDDEQPWNFKWDDLEISWYKWCGRGASSNIEITPDIAAKCLEACLAAIRKWEEETEKSPPNPS